MRHIRSLFDALRLRPLAGDAWLHLCVEPEALEIIRAASNTTSRNAPKEDDAAQEADTRDILMPSARRAAVRGSRARTTVEVVKSA